MAVDERPVRRAEVLEVPGSAAVGQRGVARGDELVLEDDRVVDVAPECRDRIEPEAASGRGLTARRLEDDQSPELRSRFPRGGPQVPQQDPTDRPQEQVEQAEE